MPQADDLQPRDEQATDGAGGRPWSKLAITSIVLGVVALIMSFTPATTFAGLFAMAGMVIGLAAMVTIAIGRNRRNVLLALVGIAISVAAFVNSGQNTPNPMLVGAPSSDAASPIIGSPASPQS